MTDRPDRPAPDRPAADRLSAAFEILAERGRPQDPDVFAAAVLRAARVQQQRSSYAPWIVGAAAAAAIGGAFTIAAVVNNGNDTDRVVPATNTSEATSTTSTTAPHSPLFFPPKSCEPIPFTPNSEDMATNVVATAYDCRDAELLIRKVRDQHNFYEGPRRFAAGDFQCTVTAVRESDEDPIPSADYDCRDGDARVTWTKT